MVSVSSSFAPPLKLIRPFFIAGAIFYLFSIVLLFFNTPDFALDQPLFLATVHIYLVGFVMMIIIGALAQLLPVVLEKGHAFIEFYPIVFWLLFLGLLLIAFGFVFYIPLVSYGGVFITISFAIFATELLITARSKIAESLSTRTMGIAAIFIVIGSTLGWVMSSSWIGVFAIDARSLLGFHIVSLLGGAVMMVVFGIVQILLPMFGLSHGFYSKPATFSYYILLLAIVLFFLSSDLKNIALSLMIFSAILHLIQVVIILNNRARKDFDIWYRSVFVAYISFSLAIVFLIGFFLEFQNSLKLFGWFFAVGFLGFLISGHLYKIIPFLVWFQLFSPLVGKQKVPMLGEMMPKRGADMQWWFGVIGVAFGAFSIFFSLDQLWFASLSFLLISGIFLVFNVFYMINFKESK